MTVAPDPVFPKASGGVMADGKEASCERGSGAEVVHTSAKDANRRDEIQEIPMTDTDVSGREPTREEIIAFLNGEGMLEDCWFGEKHPSHSGYFWWRKYLNRLRSPGGDGELVDLLVSELDRARNQIARMGHDERCFTNDPNEDACCCICGKDSALTMIDDALERAALARAEANAGEPVAWGDDIDGKIVSVRLDKSRHCTVPLYHAPQPSGTVGVKPLANLIHDALAFAVWAAGEGLCPTDGPPAPEDFLYAYSTATGFEDWDAIPHHVATTLSALTAGKPEQAVETEAEIAWSALEEIAKRAGPEKLSPIHYEAAKAAAKIAERALEARGEIRAVDFPTELLPKGTGKPEQAAPSGKHWFAVQSPTGVHIGLWDDGKIAYGVAAEYGSDYTIMELVELPVAPTAGGGE